MIRALILALTIYWEARGEQWEGQLAVATVIFNRSIQRGIRIETICLEPKQFSCWNILPDGPTAQFSFENAAQPYKLDATFHRCLGLAYAMIQHPELFQPTGPWNHYYNPALCNPAWAKEMTDVKKIGAHIFGCAK